MTRSRLPLLALVGAPLGLTDAAPGQDDLRRVLERWGEHDGAVDRDGDGAVGMRDLLLALTGREAVPGDMVAPLPEAATGTSFRSIECEEFTGEGWSDHGYEGLTTYRVYAVFEPGGADPGVLSVFGLRGQPLILVSSSGEIYNSEFADSLLAPMDFRGIGFWENQWDTYVTINASEADGNATGVSPNLGADTDGLSRNFVLENHGWYVTPSDPQYRAIDGRVLLAQLTVADGVTLYGSWNLLLPDGNVVLDVPVFCGATVALGACCLEDGMSCATVDEDYCGEMGGVFLGPGTDCIRQIVDTPCHPGATGQHCVRVVSTCPEADSARDCEPGPLLDAWVSPSDDESPHETYHDFGADGQAIPADFFGPGSDPFSDFVTFRSVPIGGAFGDADTVLRRSEDPFDRCALPSYDEVFVDIDLVMLNLESTDPVRVTYSEGKEEQFWNLELSLSPVKPASGTLSAIKTTCNGGTYSVDDLRVQPLFRFTLVEDPGEVRTFDTGALGLDPVVLSLYNGHWVSDVDPGLVVISPYCTDFHPGLTDNAPPADCDCNGNQLRDQCDIDDGTSPDCDADGVPDECQIAQGARDCNKNGILDSCECPGDIVGNCETGHDDVLAVLAAWGLCQGCPEDVTRDGRVGMADLLEILRGWGPCD